MKKLSFFAFLLISVVSFAQNKFIEVEVADTISLKPLSFQCNIYVISDMFPVIDSTGMNYETPYDPVAEQEKEKNKLKELKRKLESKKYKVGPIAQSKNNILGAGYYGGSENGWGVVINNEAEIQKLKELVEPNGYVEVSVLKYADEAKAEEQLIKKLIDKAKSKAVIIASYSGLKSGKILEVREGKPGGDFESYLTEIMKMSRLGKDNGNYTGSLSKTFVVKFAAE